MALIQSKQFNPKFTGSFVISGSKPSDGSYRANLEVIGGLKTDDVVLNDVTSSGDVNVSGDIEVGQYIKHKGDTNTFINFTDNRIRMNAGGINFLSLEDDGSAPYPFVVNNGGNRINFRVLDRNSDNLLKTDSEAFNVKLYHAGNQKLETKSTGVDVTGSLDITGSLTTSGNISSSATITALQYGGNVSGSVTSTGSFGKIKLSDDTHLNAGVFAISGSSVSTASFGMVKIHAIAGNSPITFTDTIIQQQNIEVAGHITASGNISNVSTTHVTASGNLDVGGNIVTVGDITTQGNIVAKTFIVSSSVSHFTQSFSSGSTIFGDDSGDTHEVTGSLLVTGSLNVEKGRIFEQGSSVIDHATAMAIVFGG